MGKRTRSQRRGSSPKNRVSSHRFPAANKLPRISGEVAEIVELVHSPAHTAPLAKVKFEDGATAHLGAPEGLSVGQIIAFGDRVSLRPGNVTTLDQIPEGTQICNVESRPGDGGKIAKSGGNSAMIDTRMGDYVRVRLPSGTVKDLHAKCRATIGVLGGHGRSEKPLLRAGAAHHKAKARGKLYPTVSGVAMNPVDHPHGGGNHQAVHGPNSVSRNAPPGKKVGNIAPRRTGRGRSKSKE
ncbi:MAG TPA: 50S ribosomal protein L2 [Candidatus Thalassarchaeaceae archaeon]|nr:50S ribosomal protein L2 [Candidatus Thalassarchaeaceae archaeon]